MTPSELSDIEREMAKSYVLVHARAINAEVRAGSYVRALAEAQGVVAALERLAAAEGSRS